MDIRGGVQAQLLSFAADIRDSLVYLEAGAAEALQVTLGGGYLRGLGAGHTVNLDTASARDGAVFKLLTGRPASKLIIISTQLLTATHSSVLRAAKAHPQVTSCTILCSVSSAAHASQPSTMLGPSAYDEYANALAEDIAEVRGRPPSHALLPHSHGQQSSSSHVSIRVHHLPLLVPALGPTAFVLPCSSSAVQLARIGPAPAGYFPPDPRIIGEEGLDSKGAAGLKLLAHHLLHMAASLGFRLDTFSLGRASHLLGDEISAQPAPMGSEASPEPAALLLVDRGLDLITPSAFSAHVLDRISEVLGRRAPSAEALSVDHGSGAMKWRSTDISVPMSPSSQHSATSVPAQQPPPLTGSLTHPSDAKADGRLQALQSRQHADTLIVLRKWLREAVRADPDAAMPSMRSKPGAVGPAELTALANALHKASPGCSHRNSSLIQLARAAVVASEGPAAAKYDLMRRQSSALEMAVQEGPQSVVQELIDLFSSAHQSTSTQHGQPQLGVEDVLALAITAHALMGKTPGPGGFKVFAEGAGVYEAEARGLKNALSAALVKAAASGAQTESLPWLTSFSNRLPQQAHADGTARQSSLDYDARAVELELKDKAEDLVARLTGIAVQHARVQPSPAEGIPFLQHLAASICAHAPIDATHHDTASLRGLLTTGLGRIGFGAKRAPPQPHDYRNILIFVDGVAMLANTHLLVKSFKEPCTCNFVSCE
ncbi:hypothetical protein WJX73_008190 [Symbiochloris irregularis]|uniref:Uncharacterized protein n=1 Tax=Symbiochloris irregularis TaxID=706552 RepID=A0AAW1PCF2_9CHLO